MGRKVFISYKYKDDLVQKIQDAYWEEVNGREQLNYRPTRVRDYVNKLQGLIGRDNINLGEKDGESLADFTDVEIESQLKQRIRQCSVTIVLISKGMKESKPEREQWIPWEFSYSLRKVPTSGNTKQRNAVLGIVLPDEMGSYSWFFKSNSNCNCITYNRDKIFKILNDNTFNILNKENTRECEGIKVYNDEEPSFFKIVKWFEFFTSGYNYYLDKAIELRDNGDVYDVHINMD